MNVFDFFNSIEEFGDLPHELKTELISISTVINLNSKETVLKQGGLCTKIWYLLSGSVRMYKVVNNKDITLNLFLKPRFFTDLIALQEQIPAVLQIDSVEPSVILEIDAVGLQRLLEQSLEHERVVRKIYQELLYQETKRLYGLIYNDATERYNLIIRDYPEIFQKVPQKHIASYLNISPETLSRIRKKLNS